MLFDYEINQYLKEHPDASLKEFLEYIKENEEETKRKESERKNAVIEYFRKTYVGKYVLIEFHCNAHSFIGPITDDVCYGNSKLIPCIDVYTKTSEGIRVEIGKRHINPLWLDNPYFNIVGNGPGTKCKVISQETFYETKKLLEDTIFGIPTNIE